MWDGCCRERRGLNHAQSAGAWRANDGDRTTLYSAKTTAPVKRSTGGSASSVTG